MNTTGGFDSLTISPTGTLKEFTSYTLVIDGFRDRGSNLDTEAPTREFRKFSTTFTTKAAPVIEDREVAFNQTTEFTGNPANGESYLSIEVSPDGSQLYVTSIAGSITRWELNTDGSLDLSSKEIFFPGGEFNQDGGRRGILGIVFDPEDDNTIWVTDNYPIPLNGRDNGVPDFSGRISKVTLGADGSLENATIEPYITGLPRSNGDHVTNSLEFRANPDANQPGEPNFLLYLIQGSNSAMGAPDSAWGFRPERLLNAAVMEIDHTRAAPAGGFDVTTEPLPGDGLNRRFADTDNDLKNGGIAISGAQDASLNGNFLHFDADGVASVRTGANFDSAVVAAYYNPFADNAVLRIFGEGQRNAYDLVWHSNGNLYATTNGSAGGGVVPDDPSTTVNEGFTNPVTQDDYLFRVVEGGYSGHPNALRDKFILNGANPTSGTDPNEVRGYQVGTQPDEDYEVANAYNLGRNRSPNGAIEYTSDVFGASLKGALLFTEYSSGNDLRAVLFDADGIPIGTQDFVIRDPNGDVISHPDPLDVIQGADGRLYLLTLNRSNGESLIVRLDPAPGGVTVDTTADAGTDLTLTVVDGTDPANVIFAVTGDDADIRSFEVSFNEGQAITVQLDAQNRFTADLSGLTGEVTATLTVTDGANNSADASISFTPGDATAGIFIDALEFSVLSTLTGTAATVIRRLDEEDTHEPGDSNDANGDGLNDGYDGGGYLDPNGGAEDKASFIFNAGGAGTYSFTFRMAAANLRPIAIQTNGQSETIAVTTGSFTTWQDYTIQLDLVDGPNTIIINQPGTTGPNIDSVRVSPVNVAVDGTADEGDDLAVALRDASDRAATIFVVTGADADIESYLVSFDGGTTSQPVTVTDGTFAIDTTGLSGDVTISLTVADEVPNTKTVTTAASFAPVVSNDGTAVIDGITYVLYEAENAQLSGPVVLGDDTGEDGRGAQGGAYVDFDGAADQTITWTVTVGADGTYGVDILYALAAGKDPRPMAVSVDGAQVETLPFVPNASSAETEWGPQSFTLDLAAGTHTIAVTAPGANGPNIDQLRITQAIVTPIEPGDPDADIEIQSLDPAFYDNRLHFSWLENNSAAGTPDRDFKENAFVEISNSGTNPLEFRSAEVSGPFDLADPSVFDGLTLAAGESITVEILFDRSEYTPPTTNVNATKTIFNGALTLRTNDADTPVATVDLSGFWQAQNEGGQEPSISEVWEVFGFGNRVSQAALDNNDIYEMVNDQEILSPYWRIADGVTEARMTQIAAYHGDGGAGMFLHAPGSLTTNVNFGSHAGNNNQSILPIQSNGAFQSDPFTAITIPDSWDGDDIFGFRIANFSTDPTLNPRGPVQIDGVQQGHFFRMFQALDAQGNAIANTFLGVMDYTGINYDYNDNMFVIEGVAPVGNGAGIAISGLDDAAADDRLVFSRIDNPRPNQEVRDTATFTISNDGTGPLAIRSLAVDGAFTLTGLAVGDQIAAGGSAQVTVTFTGTDPANNQAAVLHEGGLTIGTNVGTKSVALAGLAQFESEGGEEPSVAQIVRAFGYSTDVAQGELANGGIVEQVGDEVLLPYLERLDGSQPVEVIQIAAYLSLGNVGRLNLHGLDDDALTPLYVQEGSQAQSVLPGSDVGPARASFTPDGGFGLKVTVDGRPTFSAWTDPRINLADDAFNLGPNNEGHYIRFFEAKDSAGNAIPGTFIAVQDYPGGENFDYNDHMFVIKNVKAHALTADEDADGNGINDALETDADNDGTVAFFDADDGPVDPNPGGGLNRGDYVVGFNVGGPEVASQQGLDGVALRGDGDPLISYAGDGATRTPSFDLASNPNGANALPGAFKSYRDGTNWTTTVSGLKDGAYVVVLHTQETYWNSAGQRQFDISINGAKAADDLDPFAVAGGDTRVSIEALVSVSGGSFTIALDSLGADGIDNATLNAITIFQSGDNPGGGLAGETANTAPTATDLADATAEEGTSFMLDAGAAFSDAEGDTLTFTAAGLPQGLSLSAAGVITGTLPQVAADTGFAITVTASDGEFSTSEGFTLNVTDVSAPAGQQPFPGPNAPGFANGALTLDASNYDSGGQGVAYSDAPGLQGGSNGNRAGSDVEQTTSGDIGWIASGEWLEYTIEVPASGLYDLDLLLATTQGGRSATVDFYQPGAATPYASSGSIANPSSGSYTNFQPRSTDGIELQAGTQVVRVTFAGGSQDFREFTLTRQQGPVNTAPTAADLADAAADEGTSFTLDAGAAFSDADGDTLTFTATGLPQGLAISQAGLITGTLPQVAADTDFAITVTASDGAFSTSESFTLAVSDVPAPAPDPQTPFPAGGAPTIGRNAVFVDAGTFDNGGQGISWNDDPGRRNGGQTQRADTDVELVGAEQDIGWVTNGEWVEYTVNVAEAGTYDLSVNAASPHSTSFVNVSIEDGQTLASFRLPDSNGPRTSFAGTTFAETPAQQVQLDAGLQTLRVTFNGPTPTSKDLLDYRGLTLDLLAPVEPGDGPIGQAGKVTVNQPNGTTWSSVTFDQALDNPSIVMGPITANGSDPSVVRVRNVTDTGFEFQIDEWDYLDGGHKAETISWLAIEEGEHVINGQKVVAGSGNATGNDTVLDFGSRAFSGPGPEVFAQVTTANDPRAVTAQISSVTANGFELDLDMQESLGRQNALHGTETVSWIAVETGGSVAGGLKAGSVTGVTQTGRAIDFGGTFGSLDDFVFLAEMQTENDSDPADLRLNTLSRSSARFFVEEEKSFDAETSHAGEEVGFLTISSGLIFQDDTLI